MASSNPLWVDVLLAVSVSVAATALEVALTMAFEGCR
jgi:hypothetical protein